MGVLLVLRSLLIFDPLVVLLDRNDEGGHQSTALTERGRGDRMELRGGKPEDVDVDVVEKPVVINTEYSWTGGIMGSVPVPSLRMSGSLKGGSMMFVSSL